jgi:hypothetical protein
MIVLVAAGHAHGQSQVPPADAEAPASAAAPGSSAPAPRLPIDQLTLHDDLIAAIGMRPVGERRLEALVSTGSDATRRAAARASTTVGHLRFELTGDIGSSDVLGDRNETGARVEHASEHDRLRAIGRYASEQLGLARQSFTSDLGTTTYGAAWTGWRAAGRFELRALGEHHTLRDARTSGTLDLDRDAYGIDASFASRPVHLLGLGHELGADIAIVHASSAASTVDVVPEMMHTELRRAKHGRHRFLSAYLHDTIRVIESLDVHGGYVFEHWRWLTNITPIYEQGEHEAPSMDTVDADEINELLRGPRFGGLYRVAPEVALEAAAYRRMRTPTWQQLMRPVQNGGVTTIAADRLRPETITGAHAGPTFGNGTLEARALAYWYEIASPITTVAVSDTVRETANLGHAREIGVDAAASWRFAKPWLAGATYTFANTRVTSAADALLVGKQLAQSPRHRAGFHLAFDNPRLVTLVGTVRYVASRYEDVRNTIAAKPYTVVDAMAARKLVRGLAGFVAVENLFDRRYVANHAGVDSFGAPRLVQVGVRLDTK